MAGLLSRARIGSADPDLREEVRATRSQVAQGLPIVPRWRITVGPDEVSTGGRDANAHRLQLERGGESRAIVVYISATAIASSNEPLSADVVAAKTTRRRSVVTNAERQVPPAATRCRLW
jgi:hypothetical protein